MPCVKTILTHFFKRWGNKCCEEFKFSIIIPLIINKIFFFNPSNYEDAIYITLKGNTIVLDICILWI